MTSDQIKYTDGYKYQLRDILKIDTPIKGVHAVSDYVVLTDDGTLYIMSGYAWDGATNFPDFKFMLRGSAVHDAGYQLIRLGLIDHKYKDTFDRMLKKLVIEDGCPKYVAGRIRKAVGYFGGMFLKPSDERPILVAP